MVGMVIYAIGYCHCAYIYVSKLILYSEQIYINGK